MSSSDAAFPESIVKTKSTPKERTRTRRVPPYNVILENDEDHSFEFVVGVLSKALGYATERSFQLTMQAHETGLAIVWTGPKEVAELKADQIRTFHEIRADKKQLGPLVCTIEPAPGG